MSFHVVRFYRDEASLCAWGARMVARGLVKRDVLEAALRLEDCWNYLARAFPLNTMCAYAADHVLDVEDIRGICWRHTHFSMDFIHV